VLSSDGLAPLHDSMAAHVAAGRLPGLVTLVAHGGELHVDTIGSPSFGSDAPLRRDAIFRIASLSKPITAAATLSLVDEGLLRLEQPIDELLPELATAVCCARSTPSWMTPCPPNGRSHSRTCSATGSASDR
jgi:CubicO group peptidase (beta-lactamase class C family)